MKKKLFALLLAVACMILPVIGCASECDAHADDDGDRICDNCGEAITCETHTDANGDFVCDVCGTATNATCDEHVDADQNLACDVCGATLTGGCDPHKDDNADGLCDTCGGAIVIQTQVAAPNEETRVEMVVNTIPTDATLGTYIDTSDTIAKPMTGTLIEGTLTGNNKFVYTAEDDEAGLTTWTLTNLLNGVEVLRISETEGVTLSVSFESLWIRVIETKTVEEEEVVTDLYYTYSDTVQTAPFATQTVEAGEPRGLLFSEYLENGEELYTMEGLGYIFDDDKLLFAGVDMKTFVDRPDFDYVTDTIGYLVFDDDHDGYDDRILAYNLEKWMDCVYSYTIPSYYEDVNTFYLENDNMLLQAKVQLADSAVSYDFIEYGDKYDLVYVIIDPAAKTAAKTEFGYYISEVTLCKDIIDGYFTDAAPNAIRAFPIVNDRIDMNASKIFVVDNSLKILLDVEQAMGKQATYGSDITCLPNGLMRVTLELDYFTEIDAVYTTAGEFVCYLPDGAFFYRNYVEYNGKLYNYRMEELADFTEDDYYMYAEYNNYAILAKDDMENYVTEFFYYDGVNITPIEVDGEFKYIRHNSYGFSICYEAETEEGSFEDRYALYDAANRLVLVTDSAVYNTELIGSDDEVRLIYTYSGDIYLVK